MPIDDLAAPYVYKIEWIGSLILVKQTRFTSIVGAVPEDIALSITNSDGSSA